MVISVCEIQSERSRMIEKAPEEAAGQARSLCEFARMMVTAENADIHSEGTLRPGSARRCRRYRPNTSGHGMESCLIRIRAVIGVLHFCRCTNFPINPMKNLWKLSYFSYDFWECCCVAPLVFQAGASRPRG